MNRATSHSEVGMLRLQSKTHVDFLPLVSAENDGGVVNMTPPTCFGERETSYLQ
jgi:hypothetical protein